MCGVKLIAGLGILLAALYYYYLQISSVLFKPLIFQGEEGCIKIPNVMGAEDLVKWKHFVLMSSDDRGSLWELPGLGPTRTPDGAIYSLNTLYNPPLLSKISISNWDNKLAFHPHGIYLSREENRLYVVNHAYQKGGERVDVFTVKEEGEGVSLVWDYGLAAPEFPLGSLNDLAVVSPNSFYVTVYLPFPETPGVARADDTTFKLKFMASSFGFLKRTYVVFCTDADSSQAACRIVGPYGYGINGISTSADKSLILISDALASEIRVFKREKNNDLTLVQDIPLPNPADNIDLDPDTGVFYMGSFGSVISHLEHVTAIEKAHGNAPHHHQPGGSFSLTLQPSEPPQIKNIVFHNGSLLSGISASIPFQTSSKRMIVHGSWCEDGLLVCPYP